MHNKTKLIARPTEQAALRNVQRQQVLLNQRRAGQHVLSRTEWRALLLEREIMRERPHYDQRTVIQALAGRLGLTYASCDFMLVRISAVIEACDQLNLPVQVQAARYTQRVAA